MMQTLFSWALVNINPLFQCCFKFVLLNQFDLLHKKELIESSINSLENMENISCSVKYIISTHVILSQKTPFYLFYLENKILNICQVFKL